MATVLYLVAAILLIVAAAVPQIRGPLCCVAAGLALFAYGVAPHIGVG
jgi:hypothetical protein